MYHRNTCKPDIQRKNNSWQRRTGPSIRSWTVREINEGEAKNVGDRPLWETSRFLCRVVHHPQTVSSIRWSHLRFVCIGQVSSGPSGPGRCMQGGHSVGARGLSFMINSIKTFRMLLLVTWLSSLEELRKGHRLWIGWYIFLYWWGLINLKRRCTYLSIPN